MDLNSGGFEHVDDSFSSEDWEVGRFEFPIFKSHIATTSQWVANLVASHANGLHSQTRTAHVNMSLSLVLVASPC